MKNKVQKKIHLKIKKYNNYKNLNNKKKILKMIMNLRRFSIVVQIKKKKFKKLINNNKI